MNNHKTIKITARRCFYEKNVNLASQLFKKNVLIFSFLLVFFSLTSTVAAASDMKTYHNDKYHFNIDIPDSWVYSRSKNGALIVPKSGLIAISPRSLEAFLFQASPFNGPQIENWTKQGTNYIVSEFLHDAQNKSKDAFLEASGTTYINSKKFVWMLISNNKGKIPYKNKIYLYVHNNLLYQFYYFNPLKIYDENKPIIEKSIHSLTFDK